MIERRNETAFDWRVYAGQDIPVQWYFRKECDLAVAVQAWTIAPGSSEGMHGHHDERPLEELYVVVAGEAEVTVDGVVSRLDVGDALLAKVGHDHDVANVGAQPLTLIVVWGPPSPSIWQEYSMGRRPDEQPPSRSVVW